MGVVITFVAVGVAAARRPAFTLLTGPCEISPKWIGLDGALSQNANGFRVPNKDSLQPGITMSFRSINIRTEHMLAVLANDRDNIRRLLDVYVAYHQRP